MKHENRRKQSPTTKKGRYLPWQTRFLCASMKWPRSWAYENKTKHAGRRIRLTYMVVESPAFEVIE